MSRASNTVLAVVAIAVAVAHEARAQGNLSTFGFGYPPGQLSARAQATGGRSARWIPYRRSTRRR